MEELTEFINKRKKEYTQILCELIKQKTINPPGNEYLAANIIKKYLDKLNIPYDIVEKVENRPNIIAYIGKKQKESKTLIVATHLDVVPAGDGWLTNPFDPVIKENKLFGRGACDNKGQATSVLLAAEYLKQIEENINGQIIFAFCADEEMGSKNGMQYLLQEKLITADFAIIPDVSGGMEYIDIGEKGFINLRITAIGKQAHGARPNLGISAITLMSDLINNLKNHTLKHKKHKLFSAPTINFGTIKGGNAPNNVAAKCELILNIRYLPSQTSEEIINEIKSLTQKSDKFQFEILADSKPTEVPESHPLVKTMLSVTKKLGLNPYLKCLSGATDAKQLNLAGIPAIGFDFADNHIAHIANEYVNLDKLFQFSEILSNVCIELLK